LKITGDRGIDLVYDPVGRIRGMSRSLREKFTSHFPYVDALKCIVWGGRALVVGFAGGAIEKVRVSYGTFSARTRSHYQRIQLPLNLVLLKNVSIIGIFWGSYRSAILSTLSFLFYSCQVL